MNGLRHTVATLALCAALLGNSTALAWAPIASDSPTWPGSVPYSLNSAGSVDLGGFAATEAEVRRAMDDWTRVSCTSLTTNYRGSTGRVPGNEEGVSTIGWIESGWPHEAAAIGVTGPSWWRGDAIIIEADMAMNGVNFTWTAGSGTFRNVNAYSIVLHEGGHYYGLGHSNVRGSSMWPSYSGGIIGLGPDDENGICALYPGGGTDCRSTGCPTGQECVSGRCEAVVGDGTVCAPCTLDSDCGGPSDFCLRYPDGQGYCGRACGSDADCSGDRCLPTSGVGSQCGRVVGGSVSCAGAVAGCTLDSDCAGGQICDAGTCVTPTGGAGLGESCTGDAECMSMLCLGGTCTQTCDWTNPAGSCPGGFYCNADDSTCDSGYCLGGGAGAGALGDPCGADTECSTLLCESGRCSQPCIPGGALGCPDSYACQLGTLSCRGSCQRSGALGDVCTSNSDCTSSICAVLPDRTFCTDYCDPANPCPDRFTCTRADAGGDVSVCVPDFGGLGSECAASDECVSEICAMGSNGENFCTRVCDAVEPCPGGFECVLTADGVTSVCASTDPPMPEGCGCRVPGREGSSGGGALLVALMGILGLVWGWRRRR